MDIGAILIGLAVLIGVAFLVSGPLVDRRQQREKTLSEAERLREQRDRILTTLRDLDFDHASGKIQEEDYTPLRAKLVADGADVMKQLDELEAAAPAGLETELEQAIAAHRHSHAPAAPAGGEDDIERAVAARRRGRTPAAPQAAKGDDIERAVAARRQSRLAARGGDEMIRCPQCGQAALPTDIFCAKCGSKLPGAPATKDSA